MDKSANRFVTFLAIIATPLAAGAFLLSWQPSNQFFDFSPANDGFVAPRDISKVVNETQDSTVLVTCEVSKDESWIGTGWAIDSSLLQKPSDKTTIMTNFHVIDECIEGRGKVSIALLYEKNQPAEILNYDKRTDLAVLTTDIEIPP